MLNFLKSILESLLIFLLLTIFIYSQQEPEYEIINLGYNNLLHNLYGGQPIAINDSSQIILNYYDENENSMVFLWKNGILTLLPSNGMEARANDINNNSWIAGTIFNDNNQIPVYWNHSLVMMPISIPNGFGRGVAQSINDNNTIGGTFSKNLYFDDSSRAFLYSSGLFILPSIVNCGGANSSYYLYSLANTMCAVGHLYCNGPNGSFFWNDSIGQILNLGFSNYARDINNSNQIAGYSDYTNQAIRWTNNVPYFFPSPSRGIAINDFGIMIGNGPNGVSKFIEDQIIPLNPLIPSDSGIVLIGVNDINNKGEITATGYYNTNPNAPCPFLLKPFFRITHPKKDTLMIAGEVDTIRWKGGKENQLLSLQYSVDAGTTYNWVTIEQVQASEGKYGWDIPDDIIGRKAIIKILDAANGDSLAASDTFKIKPYIITRVENEEYVAYDINTDKWGFWNDEPEMWPQIWWQRFDYSGIDPITNKRYSRWQGDSVFTKANSSDHPDWMSFVGAFGVDACYADIFIPSYYPKALTLWKGNKGIWGGSCFGIAISNGLAFEMRSDFQSAYPNFPAITSPILVTTDTNVVKVVNEIYTHQFGNPHENNLAQALLKTPNQTLNELKNLLKEDNVKIRTLSFLSNDPFDKGGHAIVGYKITKDVNIDDRYYIYVYDNSHPNALNAYVRVDTLANGGNGQWYTPYAWQNWGGDKWLFLEDTASTFFANPILPKKSKMISPFVLSENEMQVLPSSKLTPMITDGQGNQTGIGSSGMVIGIPGSFPLIERNGSSGPPYGYYLQADNYSITLNNFLTESANTLLLNGNKLFEYERSGATQTQTDRLFFDGGVSVSNPDQVKKNVKLLNIISEENAEKVFLVRSLGLEQNDSVKIENPDDNTLDLISFGSTRNYQVELNYASQTGIGRFLKSNVPLAQNTTHKLIPDWTDVTNSLLIILVDEGNNGTIDDTLNLDNEVTGMGEDQGSLIPTEYRLEQNYPNPFNNSTVIKYSIPMEGLVTIKVFNIIGEEVATLVREVKQVGSYQVTFNSAQLPSGIYLYRIQTGSFVETRKMILLK